MSMVGINIGRKVPVNYRADSDEELNDEGLYWLPWRMACGHSVSGANRS